MTTLISETSQFVPLVKLYIEQNKKLQDFIEFLQTTDTFSVLQIVRSFIDNVPNYQYSYVYLFGLVDYYNKTREMFKFCFKEDVFDKIQSSEEFEQYRALIREINCISYVKPNPNPIIERFNQMKRLLQERKGELITFENMYTSVGLALKREPDDMTLYKFHKYFERLVQFKNYDTSILFATVSDKVKIRSWYASIEYKEDTPLTINEEQLKNKNINISDFISNKNKEDG